MTADSGSILPFTLTTCLPGPDRKRAQTSYRYRLTYRNPDPNAVGCILTWEVQGGRAPYQMAVERQQTGQLRLHCTCADAVFRADLHGGYCKHIRGFIQSGLQLEHGSPQRVGA